MSWSLNEVESLARKAARGSGLSWGLSDEAGKATRWLVKHGLPGPDVLAQLLTQNDGQNYLALCPTETHTKWAAPDGSLCPLITGAALSDRALLIAQQEITALDQTSYPLLLVPFVAAVAEMTDRSMAINWDDTTLTLAPEGQVALDGGRDLEVAATDAVIIQPAEPQRAAHLTAQSRCILAAETAQTLNNLAQRTYAPDTPESRMAGAGAGLTDND